VRAVSGQGGDLNNVVMAVANAEVSLQAAVAVRDKVIQAYMDIVRMPI
jgi:flagellar hook-basal body complex protein FliE